MNVVITCYDYVIIKKVFFFRFYCSFALLNSELFCLHFFLAFLLPTLLCLITVVSLTRNDFGILFLFFCCYCDLSSHAHRKGKEKHTQKVCRINDHRVSSSTNNEQRKSILFYFTCQRQQQQQRKIIIGKRLNVIFYFNDDHLMFVYEHDYKWADYWIKC